MDRAWDKKDIFTKHLACISTSHIPISTAPNGNNSTTKIYLNIIMNMSKYNEIKRQFSKFEIQQSIS